MVRHSYKPGLWRILHRNANGNGIWTHGMFGVPLDDDADRAILMFVGDVEKDTFMSDVCHAQESETF